MREFCPAAPSRVVLQPKLNPKPDLDILKENVLNFWKDNRSIVDKECGHWAGALEELYSSSSPVEWKKDKSKVLQLLEFEAEAMALSSKVKESEELKIQLPRTYTRNTHDALGLLKVSDTSEDDPNFKLFECILPQDKLEMSVSREDNQFLNLNTKIFEKSTGCNPKEKLCQLKSALFEQSGEPEESGFVMLVSSPLSIVNPKP